ncbi:MAG: DUF3429 domain-containing protein [Parvularcula sp.]
MIMSKFQSGEVHPDDRQLLQGEGALTSAAAAVAYAGSLPLIAGTLLAWARPEELAPAILKWTTLYGIALLAFFGGVRWGVAVMTRGGPTFTQLAGSVAPLLMAVALIGVAPGTVPTLAILVVTIPLLLLDDLRATRRGSGAPAWYLGVRIPLTAMMEVSFLACLALAVMKDLG